MRIVFVFFISLLAACSNSNLNSIEDDFRRGGFANDWSDQLYTQRGDTHESRVRFSFEEETSFIVGRFAVKAHLPKTNGEGQWQATLIHPSGADTAQGIELNFADPRKNFRVGYIVNWRSPRASWTEGLRKISDFYVHWGGKGSKGIEIHHQGEVVEILPEEMPVPDAPIPLPYEYELMAPPTANNDIEWAFNFPESYIETVFKRVASCESAESPLPYCKWAEFIQGHHEWLVKNASERLIEVRALNHDSN